MNGTLAIARREVAERRSIFITAAVLAVIPFAVALHPEMKRIGSAMVIAATGGFVAAVYVFGLALLLGATFVGRDLADKRLSFYFAKPVAATSIWFGKLAGNLATLFLCAAVILIPSMLAATEHWSRAGRGTALFAMAGVALFLLAHAIGTMFRSRSPLILADAVCAALAATALYGIFDILADGQATQLRNWLAWILFTLLLVLLVAAGAWQLSRGRIDVARNHRELSRFFWSATAATLVLLGLFLLWLVTVTPEDLGDAVWAAQPPAGKWMMVAGPMQYRAGYAAGFWVNVENGEYERADSRSIWYASFFTPDGRFGGQLRPIGKRRNSPVQLDVVRFGTKDVQVTPTSITYSQWTEPILNDTATRVAAVGGGLLTVQSLPDGRTLAVVRLPYAPRQTRLFFAGDDRVRVYTQEQRGLDVYELDVRARRLEHTGSMPGTDRVIFNANADGSRLLTNAAGKLLVLDGRTAAVLGTLPGRGRGLILSDRRIAIVNGEFGKLSIYGSDYALQREIALPGMRIIPYMREIEGGRLLVAGHRAGPANEPDGRGWTAHVVDLEKGAMVRTGRDLRPAAHDIHFGLWERDPRRVPAKAGAPFVFRDRRGGVVLWDAATGSRRAVTRASASLPAALLAAVLHFQPIEQGAEVVDDCCGIHLPLAR